MIVFGVFMCICAVPLFAGGFYFLYDGTKHKKGRKDAFELAAMLLGIALAALGIALACFGVFDIDLLLDTILSVRFILGLLGLLIVVTIVYGLYRGLGPRRFKNLCIGLSYAILWIILFCNSERIAGEYAWILNTLPGIPLLLYLAVKIYKAVNKNRFDQFIYCYETGGDGFEDKQLYKSQRKLQQLIGKKKYLYGLKCLLRDTKDSAFEKRVLAEDSTGFEGLLYEKQANWGTKAGIASALFGSAAGVAVAVDEIVKTEQYNQQVREHNANLINSGWQPGAVKAARTSEARSLAADVDYLSTLYQSLKHAQIEFNPNEEAHITVKCVALNSSGYMDLHVSNTCAPAKIGEVPASLDGIYKIQVLDSRSRIVGDAYYNPPGFAELDRCNIGFCNANQIRVVAAPKRGCTFSKKEKYTFKIIPTKVWKIAQNDD